MTRTHEHLERWWGRWWGCRLGRRRGFTLVELIATLVLTSLAMPTLMVAVRDATVRQAAVNQRTVARWLAHDRLEQVIADRHSVQGSRGYANVLTASYAAESPVGGFAGFSRSVSVLERNQTLTAAGTGYKVVTVTVMWTDVRSGSASLALQTVITDY